MYSRERYSSLLALARQAQCKFIGFQDSPDASARNIYLRHDVDYSLDMALELAQVNASHGVRGTFFVLLRSQIYNALSQWSLDRICRINDFGQHVAFHYAFLSGIPVDDDRLAALVTEDFEILRSQIPDMQPVFSWHNPDPVFLRQRGGLVVPGMVNVYSEPFTRSIPYCSDSNLRYTPSEFEHILKQEDHHVVQLLLHPFNWMAGGKSMSEVMAKTWQYVIRERELEFSLNHTYEKLFPQGMPADVLEMFSREWLKAAMQKAK